MASFAQSGPSRKPAYLGASLVVGAALAVAGFVVGTDGADIQPREEVSPRDAAVAEAVVPAVAAPRVDQAQFSQRIPAELLVAPPSVTMPSPPDAQATGSLPAEGPVRAVIPTPRKRPTQDTRSADPPRSASAQIARIKTALKLTPEQERYWPPVEAALRDIVTQVSHESVQSRSFASGRTAVDPERVQRLTSAAMPLLMTFDEAQKREVRRIARNMGLDNVASAI
ncbi:MAG: hypothetical protein ABSG76_04695 [Xanthobacteraceae bacterium]